MKDKLLHPGLTKMELLAALDMSETGEVPMEVVARLGLPVEEKPGNAWLGVSSQLVVSYENLKMPVTKKKRGWNKLRKTC